MPGGESLRRRGRLHVNLGRVCELALRRVGVPGSAIESVGPCTRCASSLLHSYRRDGGRQGRQVSFYFPCSEIKNDESFLRLRRDGGGANRWVPGEGVSQAAGSVQ